MEAKLLKPSNKCHYLIRKLPTRGEAEKNFSSILIVFQEAWYRVSINCLMNDLKTCSWKRPLQLARSAFYNNHIYMTGAFLNIAIVLSLHRKCKKVTDSHSIMAIIQSTFQQSLVGARQ